MNDLKRILTTFFLFISFLKCCPATAHDIIFCGERIPIDNDFISTKLMDVIRRQIPNVNLPELRRRTTQYFPYVEDYLQKRGLPEDLKYVAIVESGFRNLVSRAGARGFWQLMPKTAQAYGLVVSGTIDERDNIEKATYAACKEMVANYLMIRKEYGISSWVLTAAAYNTGIGNMFRNINNQGLDYFSMNLNPETALYVYKIIAVKELFEYPELYMKDFGYNVFSSIKPLAPTGLNSNIDSSIFNSMVVNVDKRDGEHPDSISVRETVVENATDIRPKSSSKKNNAVYVAASIDGKYKNFQDGELVAVKLQDNLMVKGIFNKKGNVIKGTGWLIDGRIFVDLGYGDHTVVLINDGKKGIAADRLKNKQPVLLRVQTEDANM